MRRPFAVLAAALVMGAFAAPAAHADDGFTIKDPRITESSGLAASRQHPGIYWTHNDQENSKGTYLYAVDSSTGETVATITLSGVGTQRDVEAVFIGPDNQIYVGDIGDNEGVTWDHVWIYKFAEPKNLSDRTIRATQYVVKYSDGSRDAESLVVHPRTGRVYIVDKKEEGGHLYEGPAELSTSGTNVFKPIAPVENLQATDATLSPNGEKLVIRSYFGAFAYDWNDGDIKKTGRLSVPFLGQGESVTYTADGSQLMYGAEGSESSVEPEDAPEGGGASGSSKSPTGEGGSASGGGGDSDEGTLTRGALVVALACAAVFGVRRLFRKG
ncbi:WD40 repeat domain-containing protein [Streptomyces sp. NPDC050803]|uniref:WD40 repeat domain-containing protein n=1 Tax=unclassified Streptomyces TaxID=2593676 RepID=UPI00342D19CA